MESPRKGEGTCIRNRLRRKSRRSRRFWRLGSLNRRKTKHARAPFGRPSANSRDYLAEQHPPVRRIKDRRATELVRDMLLNDQEKVIEQPVEIDGKTATMYKLTVAVRVEPQQVLRIAVTSTRKRSALGAGRSRRLGRRRGAILPNRCVDQGLSHILAGPRDSRHGALLGGLWWLAK